ncbi:GYD domain-containing protein [Streptomyces albospinus]|uniref:GYD domain-containing protein n=1 Tax=Streptomyces albospinus TaxID=285515 RepID=A0ABQ2VKS1_9ACTN|nr:GYD domain-containing protein [Streptomyces albospinus]GGU94414.1 GYD domain-containing protein [Streptomyces albospinus]
MPTYISLLNWTDQGIRRYKDTAERADAFAAGLERLGAKLVNLYWTVGPYDLVGVIEAPDEETATAAILATASAGNIRSTTLRAFDKDEMGRIIAKSAD